MDFTDLTKVMLQGRRFFRPFDLETRGLRRVLHPFAGVISAFGFAIAVGAFLWKDVVAERAKEIVSALETKENTYNISYKIDHLFDTAAEIEARVRPNFDLDRFSTDNALDISSRIGERIIFLRNIIPKGMSTEAFDKKIAWVLEEVDRLSKQIEDARLHKDRPETKTTDSILYGIKLRLYYALIEEEYFIFFKEVKEEKEKYLELVTKITYVLYSFGLVTGVLGQLVGVKPEGIDWEP